MKFNVFNIYNKKSGNTIECAVIRTDNTFLLVTVLDNKTKVREYKSKKQLINDIMILKRKTDSWLLK